MKLHSSRKRPRFYSFSNQMTQFTANSRVIVSKVDVSEDVSLSPVRRILLKIPNTRQEKLCEIYIIERRGKVCSRGSRYGEKSPVEEVSRTVRRVLWRTPNAQLEQSC